MTSPRYITPQMLVALVARFELRAHQLRERAFQVETADPELATRIRLAADVRAERARYIRSFLSKVR